MNRPIKNKHTYIIFIVLLGLIFSLTLLSSYKKVPRDISPNNIYAETLTVIANKNSRPFSFVDKNNNYNGYNMKVNYAFGDTVEKNIGSSKNVISATKLAKSSLEHITKYLNVMAPTAVSEKKGFSSIGAEKSNTKLVSQISNSKQNSNGAKPASGENQFGSYVEQISLGEYMKYHTVEFAIIFAVIFAIIIAGLVFIHKQKLAIVKATELSSLKIDAYQTIISEVAKTLNLNVLEYNLTKGTAENEKTKQYFDLLLKDGEKTYDNFIDTYANVNVGDEFRTKFIEHSKSENLIKFFESGKDTVVFTCFVKNSMAGEPAWLQSTIKLFHWKFDNSIRVIQFIKDITKEKELEMVLLEKAEIDPLTELYNRSTTTDFITTYLLERRNRSTVNALLVIDVDNFNHINNTLGHNMGANILSDFGKKLKSLFRKQDILGRVDGDEFFVFLTNIHDLDLLSIKAKEICDTFRNTYENEGHKATVTVSVGIAISPKHGRNLDELHKKAKIALEYKKENGKDGFTIYSDEIKK